MPEATPMRALTLWQPWASLIAIGVKPFETRSWATRYRGPLAIHAGADRRGLALCRGEEAIEAALADAGLTLDALPFGAIVAVAELVACWPSETIVAEDLDDPFGNFAPGRYGWHLHRVQALATPLPCTGRQGLWPLPAALVAALEREQHAVAAPCPHCHVAGWVEALPGQHRYCRGCKRTWVD